MAIMTSSQVIQISVAALFSGVLMLMIHWSPWTKVIGDRLLVRYVMGVLSIVLPFSGLLILWKSWLVLLAIWAIIFIGGSCTVIAYGVDSWLSKSDRLTAAEREAKKLRPEVPDGKDG
jgi:hypothetical protein